jgi:NADH:ubiquinone oxidoreductase subunit 4 (subunit M)
MKEISWNEKIILSVIVVAIFMVGVYPQPFFELTKDSVAAIFTKV